MFPYLLLILHLGFCLDELVDYSSGNFDQLKKT